MESAGPLEGVGDAQEARLVEVFGEDLHAHGKAPLTRGVAAGDADSRDPRQAGGDGIDVGKVHLKGIVHFFAELEGRDRRGRGDDDVDFIERLDEIAGYESAYFLSF